MTYKLKIEYDGTRFSGWQEQMNQKTVQGQLNLAAKSIFGIMNLSVTGSGRTDRGVHAIEQVAHFAANKKIPTDVLKLKFNDFLPHDINILSVEKAPDAFHSRHSAINRSYLYVIAKRRSAFGKNYVWWIKDKLDVEKMYTASQTFVGLHDFSSFADKDLLDGATKVGLESIEFVENRDYLIIRIVASHFLHKMVRRIIGTLVEIGRMTIKSADLIACLNSYNTLPSRYTAPPSGLYLEKVVYGKEDFRKPLEQLLPSLPFFY
ncbi:MAG TPA: tRNA pseudouridine(38-40) synthase TruA [Ignavibacteriaceae bacterium]|nr:tRNA pseudouridine(38-40) synthase TruA [Ignavibacteriaceae bacterium]HPO57001.1 tRNA pseudouridine(38-40) synthase TruA [Ignavibacteriaceae bacterium]